MNESALEEAAADGGGAGERSDRPHPAAAAVSPATNAAATATAPAGRWIVRAALVVVVSRCCWLHMMSPHLVGRTASGNQQAEARPVRVRVRLPSGARGGAQG